MDERNGNGSVGDRMARPCRGMFATHGRSQAGQVELVIVFPVVMLVILVLLQAVFWFLGRSVAFDAAQDGVRAAAVVDGSSSAGVAAAKSDLAQLAGPMLSNTTVGAIRNGNRAQVTVTGRAESIVPGWSLIVTASASLPVEIFRP